MENSVLGRKRQRTDTSPFDDMDTESQKPKPQSPKNASVSGESVVWEPFGAPLRNKLRLVVGPERISIVVEYWAIEHISPVLRNMIHRVLDDRGLAENDEQYVELRISEEKPEIIMIFLGLVYATRLPQYDNITPSQLLDLALLADKWVCTDRLFYSVEYYFSRLGLFSTPEGLWQAYAASYMLAKSNYFQVYSNRLASSYRGSFLPFVKLMPDIALSARLCLALEERRSARGGLNGISGILCLDCFRKATDSFLPNRDCSSCRGCLATLPPASLTPQELPAAANMPFAEKTADGSPTNIEASKSAGFKGFSGKLPKMVPGQTAEEDKRGLRLVPAASSSSTPTRPQNEKAVTQLGA
ncbi:uncharacterized protein G6M90_00g069500 [Metarhizium brunneum]|uniref:BTB domain-containing protein n=1 Tax=Metarhizium brunneum TaxID=500148 RepID=A0A7D5UZQ3_9HYPO